MVLVGMAAADLMAAAAVAAVVADLETRGPPVIRVLLETQQHSMPLRLPRAGLTLFLLVPPVVKLMLAGIRNDA